MQTLNDIRSWPETGFQPIVLAPKPLTLKSRLQAVGEMLVVGFLILLCFFGCGDDAKAEEPINPVLVTAFIVQQWSQFATLNAGRDPHFPFGADKRGRPIFPISHTRDGELIVGTATAFGDEQ